MVALRKDDDEYRPEASLSFISGRTVEFFCHNHEVGIFSDDDVAKSLKVNDYCRSRLI